MIYQRSARCVEFYGDSKITAYTESNGDGVRVIAESDTPVLREVTDFISNPSADEVNAAMQDAISAVKNGIDAQTTSSASLPQFDLPDPFDF